MLVDYTVHRCVACTGNERDAANRQLLKDAGIDHVLNVTSHVPLHFADDVTMTYCRIPASDSGCQNLKQFFTDIVTFIGKSLSEPTVSRKNITRTPWSVGFRMLDRRK